MRWEESGSTTHELAEADMIDVSFRIKGQFLAVDHHHALAKAISHNLPWFHHEPAAGIHPIQVAPTAHGWSPPRLEEGEVWQLSKRTRLVLRVPVYREHDVQVLTGKLLSVESETIEVGESRLRRLTPADPLFSRQVITEQGVYEPSFVDWLMTTLEPHGIAPGKVVCGRTRTITTPDNVISTRSVLVASLSASASIRLQCRGLGDGRNLGCGIFIPHKGIEALRHSDDHLDH